MIHNYSKYSRMDFFMPNNQLVPKLIQNRLEKIVDMPEMHWSSFIQNTEQSFKLSEEACWQILHLLANLGGENELGKNFSVVHLNPKNLATLYKILSDFEQHFEKTHPKISTLFQEKILITQDQLFNLCQKNSAGAKEALCILKGFKNIHF